MKALKIYGAMDLRIEDFHLEELTPNQVEISVAMGGMPLTLTCSIPFRFVTI